MSLTRFFTLANGCKMPSVGLGTFQMKGDQLKEALDFAICIGYRHIDTAVVYKNEKEIGEVIRDRIKSGYVKRKDLFITSKVPRPSLSGNKKIVDCAMQSLEDLKLRYLNMLLIHSPWPCTEEKDNEGNLIVRYVPLNTLEIWRTFESLQREGLVSNIGVSNFTAKQITRILEIQKVPLSNLQLEAHIYNQQDNLKKLCDENNIVVSAYSPLGSPARPSHHFSGDGKALSVLEDPVIMQISDRYKKTEAQVLLNFLLKRGMVVLPKSSMKERLKDNLDCLEWSLSDSDFKTICCLNRRTKIFSFLYMKDHPDYCGGEEF